MGHGLFRRSRCRKHELATDESEQSCTRSTASNADPLSYSIRVTYQDDTSHTNTRYLASATSV